MFWLLILTSDGRTDANDIIINIQINSCQTMTTRNVCPQDLNILHFNLIFILFQVYAYRERKAKWRIHKQTNYNVQRIQYFGFSSHIKSHRVGIIIIIFCFCLQFSLSAKLIVKGKTFIACSLIYKKRKIAFYQHSFCFCQECWHADKMYFSNPLILKFFVIKMWLWRISYFKISRFFSSNTD